LDTLTILQDVFRDVFDNADLVIDEKITSEHIDDWDSVAQVNLVLTIENEFAIQLNTAEATETSSVQGFLVIIAKYT